MGTSTVVQHEKQWDVDQYLQKYQLNDSSKQVGFLPFQSTQEY